MVSVIFARAATASGSGGAGDGFGVIVGTPFAGEVHDIIAGLFDAVDGGCVGSGVGGDGGLYLCVGDLVGVGGGAVEVGEGFAQGGVVGLKEVVSLASILCFVERYAYVGFVNVGVAVDEREHVGVTAHCFAGGAGDGAFGDFFGHNSTTPDGAECDVSGGLAGFAHCDTAYNCHEEWGFGGWPGGGVPPRCPEGRAKIQTPAVPTKCGACAGDVPRM